MKLDREQIIKALECCSSEKYICEQCPIDKKIKDDCECGKVVARNALSLLKELTEENERLRAENDIYSNNVERIAENYHRQGRADTVREFAERLKQRKVSYGNITFRVVPIDDIDQIAKEMLEDGYDT